MGHWTWLHHPNTQWPQGSKEITDEIANWLPWLPQRSSSTIPLSRLPEHLRGKKNRKHKQSRRIMWLCIEPWSQGPSKALRISDSDPALMDRWRYIVAQVYFGYGNVSNTMVNLVTLPILGRSKDDSINLGERIIYPSPIVWALGEWFPSKTVLTWSYLHVICGVMETRVIWSSDKLTFSSIHVPLWYKQRSQIWLPECPATEKILCIKARI